MQYRVNPRNGDRISALGLGCMRFPGSPGRPDPRLARELVSNCVRCGACAARCPQHIDIPARLEEVGRRFQPGAVGWALRLWSRTR